MRYRVGHYSGTIVIQHFLNPPNWFTAASIFCSVYALTLLAGPGDASPELLAQAATLIVFGGIFDMMDGRVARLTKRFSEFGVQLDSIADMVGFGVAPVVLVYAWSLHELGTVGVAIAVWYAICAAFRLARFNVESVERRWEFPGHSQGLTSTMAGGMLVTSVWVSNDYLIGVDVPAWFVGLLTVSVSFLMISSVPFRNFKDLRENRVARRLFAVFLASCIVGAVALHPSMWFGIGGALYLVAGLLDGLVVAVHHRRLGRALLLDDDVGDELLFDEDADNQRAGDSVIG